MYKTRWITALCLIPFVITLIYIGDAAFYFLVCAVTLIALWEYYGIVFSKSAKTIYCFPVFIGLISCPAILWGACQGNAGSVIFFLVGNIVCSGIYAVLRFKTRPDVLENITKQVQGVVYIPVIFALLAIVRSMPDGGHWVLFILVTVFAGDTGALYIGTYFGKHKLSPSVSPNKTIEGALGGLAASLVGGMAVKFILLADLPVGFSLLFCLLCGLFGQIGDLFESALKRASGIKDSGAILPGHGGILDRVDAILFAAPVAYLFRVYIF